MATKLSLYNGALALLGETPLSSLSEDRPARHWLDRSWDNGVLDFCLEQGQWNWATRSTKITYSTTIIPAYGPKYAYEVPSDFKGINSVWIDENFTAALEGYIIEAGVIYSNWDVIFLKYVSNAATYGGNLAKFPEVFAKYVEARLANEAQPNITNSDSVFRRVEVAERTALAQAKNSDKRDKPLDRLPLGNWTRSRLGGNPWGYNNNHTY